jgi:hypothetical protein
MLRWTIRILIAFVLLILAAAGIVHLVLESVWLESLILAKAGDAIGMNVTADSISIEWGGRTTIRNAAVAMPLTGDVTLAAEKIEVVHEIIPLLLVGRPVNLRSVEVDSPEVHLRRHPDGRWNVQDIWTRLQTGHERREKKGAISLPQVAVRSGRVRIEEPNGIAQTVGPVSFHARPEGRLLWRFEAEVPRIVGVHGRVAEGRDWAHEVEFVVEDIAPLVQSLVGSDLSPLRATGRWEGKVARDSVMGTIRFDSLVVGSVAARGDIVVQAGSGQVAVTARDLIVGEPNVAGREIRLGGAIRAVNGEVRIEQLAATWGSVLAQIQGRWDLNAQSGQFTGSWATAGDEQGVQNDGTCQVVVKSSRFGRKTLFATFRGAAKDSLGDMAFAVDLEGAGPDWRQSQWKISIPTMLLSHQGKQVDLAEAGAAIRVAWPEIRLTDLRVPGAKATAANAVFDSNARRWSASFAIDGLPHLAPWGLQSLDVRLTAEGDDRGAHISEFRAVEGERIVTASGRLSFREKGLQDVRLMADWPAREVRFGPTQTERPLGRWRLEGDVFGRIEPLGIEMTGQLTGQNIVLGAETVRRLEVPVRLKADDEAIRMATDSIDLFGGRWRLSARHDPAASLTQVGVTADDLSLESLAVAAGLTVDSRGRAHAEIQVAVQDFDLRSAVATGSWSVQDVDIAPLRVERVQGKLRIADGRARLEEILLEQEGGKARASVEVWIDNPHCLFVDLTTERWPIRLEESPLLLYADGKSRLRVNLIKRTADGEARLTGTVLLKEQELARVRLVALAQDQTLDIEELYAETLGGDVEGKVQICLDRLLASSAKLQWQNIEPKLLEPWAPQLARFQGLVSGSFVAEHLGPAARSPEPLRFSLSAEVENGWFGPAEVESLRVTGCLGDSRLLIDEARLRAFEGQVNARARVSTHGGIRYGNLTADFNDLNLDQIVHVIDPEAMAQIGHLSGTVALLGSSAVLGKDFSPLQGQARVNLTRSDLGNNSIIGTLYNTLNLQFGPQEPTGGGDLTIRLEGPALVIPAFTYFNRGVEVRGAVRIADLHRGAQSEIEGFAVGSTRVLRGVNLPGVRSLDRLLTTFQSGAASVSIGGTLGETQVQVVPLPVVLDPFRRLLWAQLRQ